MFDDRQIAMGRNDKRTGGVKGFWTDEVLANPGKSVTAQGGDILSDHWFKPNIAGLANQDRAQADLEILDLGLPLAQVCEGLRESGSSHELKKNVRHAGFGHALLNGGAQSTQALGFFKPIERRDDNFRFAADSLYAQVWIARHAGGDTAIGLIEKTGKTVNFGGGVKRTIEHATDHHLGFLPGRAFKQATPWVAIANAGLGEDVAPFERRAPGGDDGADIGSGIADPAAFIHDVMTPGFWDRGSRRIAHRRTRPVGNIPEISDGLAQSVAAGRRTNLDPRRDIEKQSPGPAPSSAKFRIEAGVAGFGDGVDLGHSGIEIGARKPLEKRGAPVASGRSSSVITRRAMSRRRIAALSRSRKVLNRFFLLAASESLIKSVNRASASSAASSCAVASSVWNSAATVAVRRGSWRAAMADGLPMRATRASRLRVAAGTPLGRDGRKSKARIASSRSR
jgi:hypothetical protein